MDIDNEQQLLLINQLKDLIRQKDQEVEEKAKALKDVESKLSKARLQVKAKDAKLSTLLKKKDTKDNTDHGTNISHTSNEQSSRAKIMMQQKRIEEKEAQISKQHQALKEQEDRFSRMEQEFHSKHAELTEQLKNVSTNRGIDVEAKQPEDRHVEELYGAIVNKDQRIAELTAKLDEREAQLKTKDKMLKDVEGSFRGSSSNEEHQRLLLEKLSSKLSTYEEQAALISQEHGDRVKDLEQELEQFKEQVSHLKQRLADKEETVEVKVEQILQMKREHDVSLLDSQEETQEQDQLIRSLKQKLHEQNEVLLGKEKVVQLLQNELQDKSQEHEEFQKTINILQQNLRETVEGRQLLMEEVRSLQNQSNTSNLGQGEPNTAQLVQALQQYEQAYKQALESNKLIMVENNDLKEKLQSVEETYTKLKETNESSYNEMQATNKELSDSILSLKDQIRSMQQLKEENAKAVEVRMQTVLDQLDAQTKVLEDQTSELHEYKDKIQLLESSNPDEKIELEAARLQTKELESSVEVLRSEVSSLQASLSESQQLYEDLQTASSQDLEKLRKEHLEELETLKEQCEISSQQLYEATTELESRELANEELRENVQNLEKFGKDLQEKLEDSERNCEILESKVTLLEESSSMLQEQLVAVQEETKTLENDLKTYQTSAEQLESSLAAAKNDCLNFESQVKMLVTEKESLQQSVEEIELHHQEEVQRINERAFESLHEEEQKSASANAEIEKLKIAIVEGNADTKETLQNLISSSQNLQQKNNQLEDDIAICRNSIASHELEIEKLLLSNQSYSHRIEELNEEVTSRNSACSELTTDLAAVKTALQAEKEIVETMAKEADVAVETINNLNSQVQQMEKSNSLLEQEKTRLNEVVSSQKEELHENLKKHENDGQEKESTIKLLTDELKWTTERSTTLKNELESSQMKISLIEEQLCLVKSELDNVIHSKESEVSTLKEGFQRSIQASQKIMEEITQEKEILSCSFSELKNDNDMLRDELQLLQKDLSDSKLHSDALEVNITEQQAKFQSDLESMTSISAELEKANHKISIITDEKCKIENSLCELQSSFNHTSNALETTQTKLIAAEEDVTLLKHEKVELTQKLAVQEESIAKTTLTYTKQSENLQKELQNVTLKSNDTFELLKTELGETQGHLQDKSTTIITLTSKLDEATAALEKSEKVMLEASISHKNNLVQINEEVSALKLKLNGTEEELQQTNLHLHNSKARNIELTNEVEVLNNTIQELESDLIRKTTVDEEKKIEEVLLLQRVLQEKDDILKALSEQYSKLQSEMVESKQEFDRWKNESEIMKERDHAVQKADELQDTMEKHNAQLESRLTETEDRLEEVERERDEISQRSKSYHTKSGSTGDYHEENLGDFHPLAYDMRNEDRHKQGMEFLQLQLEELAHEQEIQTREHEKTTTKLNSTINRLREEKQQLLEAFEKQSESLNDVLKRYEEKDSEWNKLSKLVEEQQQNLIVAQASQQSSDKSSEKNSRDIQNLEAHLFALQEKYKEKMDEVAIINDEKEKYEYELPELKSKLKSLRQENSSLVEQAKQYSTTVENLQRELDHALENAETNNSRHQEEVERLKSWLRNKDEEISALNGDIEDQNRDLTSLNQVLVEKNYENEQLTESLTEHQNKVSNLLSELRERDSEAAALSQKRDGAVESAQIRAQDLAEYVATLESRIKERDEESAALNLEVEDLRQKLSFSSQKITDLNRTSQEKEEVFQTNLYELEEKYQNLLNDDEVARKKFAAELNQEKQNYAILQEKYENQVSDVRDLTSTLESQIQEANQHHQEEAADMERKVEELERLLEEERAKIEAYDREMSDSNKDMEELKLKVSEQEKWQVECQEKDQLCENLKTSCDLLEERLNDALKRARNGEEETSRLEQVLNETIERLSEREELVKRLGTEITQNSDEIRSLKEALRVESERQLNELNSVVESRTNERDEQISSANSKIESLNVIINERDEEIETLTKQFETLKKSSEEDSSVLNEMKEVKVALENKLQLLQEESSKNEESWMATSIQLEKQVKDLSESSDKSLLESSKHEEEISRLSEQLNQSRDAEKSLQEQAAKHEQQKEKVKKIVRALQVQLKHSKEEKENLEAKVTELQTHLSSQSQIAEEKLLKQEQSDDKLKSLLEQIQDLEQEVVASQRKCEESEILSSSLKEQMTTLMMSSQEEIEVKNDMITRMKSELANLAEKQSKNEESLMIRMEEISAGEKAKDDHQTKLLHQIDALEKERAELLQANEGLLNERNQLQAHWDELSSMHKTTKENTLLLKEALASVQEEKLLLEQQLTAFSVENENYVSGIREMESTHDDMKSSILTQVAARADLEETCRRNESILEEKTELLQMKSTQLDDSLHKLSEMKEELFKFQTLSKDLEDDKDKYIKSQDKLSQIIKDKTKTAEEQAVLVASLKQELESVYVTVKQQNEEKEELTQIVNERNSRSDEEQKMLQESLRSTIQELNQTLQVALRECDDLKDQVATLQDDVKDKEDVILRLRDESAVKESLQESVNTNKEEISSLIAEKNNLLSDLKSKDDDLQSALSEVVELKQEKNQTDERYTILMNDQKSQINLLSENLESMQENQEKLNQQNIELQTLLSDTTSERCQLEEKIRELNLQISTLNEQVIDLKSEQQQVSSALHDKEVEENTNSEKLQEEFQHAIALHKEQVLTLQEECKALKQRENELADANCSVNEERNNLFSKVSEVTDQLTQRDEIIEELRSMLAEEKKNNENFKNRLEETDTMLSEVKKQMEVFATSSYEREQETKLQSEQAIDILQKDLAIAKQEISHLQEHSNDLQTQCDNVNDLNKNLQDALVKERDTVRNGEADYGILQNEFEKVNNTKSELSAHVEDLNSALSEKEEVIKATETELLKLKAEIVELKQEPSNVPQVETSEVKAISSDEVSQKILDLEKLVEAKEKMLSDSQRKLKASLVSRKSLMAKVKEFEANKSEIESLNASLVEEKAALESRLSESLNSSQLVEETLLGSKNDETCINEEIGLLKSQLKTKDNELNTVQVACTTLQQHVETLTERCASLTAYNKTLQETLKEKEESNFEMQNPLQQTVEQNKIEMMHMLDEKNGLIAQLNKKQDEIQRIVAEVSLIKEERVKSMESDKTIMHAKDRQIQNVEESLISMQGNLEETSKQNHELELSLKEALSKNEALQTTVNELHEKVADLKLEKATEDSESKIRTSDELSDKIQQLEKIVEEKEKSHAESQKKLKAALASRKALITKVKDFETNKTEIETLNASLHEDKLKLENRLSESLNSSQLLEETLLGSNNDKTNAEEEMFRLKSDLEEKESELNKSETEHRVLREQFAALSEKSSSMTSEYQALILENEQIPKLKEKLKLLTDDRENILQTNSNEVLDLTTQISNLNQELSNLKSSNSAMQKAIDLKTKENYELNEKLSVSLKSNEQLQGLQNSLRSMQEENKVLEDTCKKSSACVDDLRAQLELSTVELSASNAEVVKLTHALQSVQEVNHQDTENYNLLDAAKQELLEKSTEVIQLQDKLSNQSADSENLKHEFAIKLEKLNDLLMKNDEKIKQIESEKEVMLRESENMKEVAKSSQANVEELHEKVASLRGEHERKVDEIDNLRLAHDEEVRNLNAKIEELVEKANTPDLNNSADSIQQDELKQSASTNKVTLLQRKLKAALLSRKELIAETKKQGEEIKTKTQLLEEREATINALNLCLNDKDTDIIQLNKNAADMEENLLAKNSEVEKLNFAIISHKDLAGRFEKERNAFEKKVEELGMEISTLQTCNKDMNEMVSAMELRTAKLEKSLSDRTDSLRSAQKCIRKLENTLGQGEASLQDAADLKKKLNEWEAKYDNLTTRYNSLEAEKREKVVMLEQVMADFENEVVAKEDLLIRCKGLEKILDTGEPLKRGNNEVTVINEEFDSLKSLCDKLEVDNTFLKEKLEVIEKTVSEKKGQDMDKLQTDHKELKIKYSEMQNRFQTTELQCTELQEKVSSLENELFEKTRLIPEQDGFKSTADLPTMQKETLQASSPVEKELFEARREVITETLRQLKSTQPENWEQEPGIKKLIDKLEETAQKAGASRKEAMQWKKKLQEMTNEKKKLSKNIKDLTESNEKLKTIEEKQLDELKELREVKEEFDSLKKLYDAVQRDCDHLNSALQVEKESYEQIQKRVEHENTLLRKKLEEGKAMNEGLNNELQQSSQLISEMKQQYSTLEHATKDLQLKLDASVSDAESMKLSFSKQVEENKAALSYRDEKIGGLENSLKALKNDNEQLQTQNSSLEETYDEAKKNINLLTEKYTVETNEFHEKMHKSRELADNQAEELQSNISNLVKDLALKDEDLSAATFKIKELTDEVNHLKELSKNGELELQKRESKISDLTQLLDVKTEENISLGSRLEVDSLQGAGEGDREELVDHVEHLQTELKKRQSLVSDLVSDCMRLKTELASVTAENEKNKGEVAALVSKTQSLLALKAQYETNENYLKSELAEKDRVIHKQQEEVEEVRNQHHALLQEFGSSSVPELQILLAAYVDNIKSLKTEVRDREDEITQLKNQIESMANEKEECDQQISELRTDVKSLKESVATHEAEYSAVLERCSIAEQDAFTFEKELEESRRMWEKEKTAFIMQVGDYEEKSKETTLQLEDYKQHVAQIKAQAEDTFNELEQKDLEIENLKHSVAHLQTETHDGQRRYGEVMSFLEHLKHDFWEKNSIFQQVIQNSDPLVVTEGYQQSSPDHQGDSFEFIHQRLRGLEAVLNKQTFLKETEEKLRFAEEQCLAAEGRIQLLTDQLHQALSERDQLHSQLSIASNAVQQYEAQYKNLHSEYMKLNDQLSKQNLQIDATPTKDEVPLPQLQQMEERLEEVTSEKDLLAERLLQVEEQLSAEVEHSRKIENQWREEVHSMWKAQRGSSTTVDVGNPSEEDAVLLKPGSFRKTVTRSRNICAQWLKGKSLARSHLRPYSFRAFVILYFIFIHAFSIKCAVGL